MAGGAGPYRSTAGGGADRSITNATREAADDVRRATAEQSGHVAHAVGEQAGRVAEEAAQQARDLLMQAREQVGEQARLGQQWAGEGLRAISGELSQMADGSDHPGPVTDLARQAAHKVDGAAGWLERHKPAELIDEARSFARRRPGTFLLGAAAAGVIVGRLTRGAADTLREESSDDSGGSPESSAGRPDDSAGRADDSEGRADEVSDGDFGEATLAPDTPMGRRPSSATARGRTAAPVPDPAEATTVGEYVNRLERVAAHQGDAAEFGGRA